MKKQDGRNHLTLLLKPEANSETTQGETGWKPGPEKGRTKQEEEEEKETGGNGKKGKDGKEIGIGGKKLGGRKKPEEKEWLGEGER